MNSFYSNGKLLLTAEYVVLDGAKALALPTKFGQSLEVKNTDTSLLHWKSYNSKNELWFETTFNLDSLKPFDKNPTSERLQSILNAAKELNKDFFNGKNGLEISTKLDFPNNWGLGSSSTLINNIANWAKVDAFTLLEKTFGGSGYDIACASNDSAILYQIETDNKIVSPIDFNPSFKDDLYFIHLNKKQNSREGIKAYNQLKNESLNNAIEEINRLTNSIVSCKTLNEFEHLISEHETIISKLINRPTIKSDLFSDYKGQVKSLGAWGGDFVLVTKTEGFDYYFKNKGFNTIISYSDMIK